MNKCIDKVGSVFFGTFLITMACILVSTLPLFMVDLYQCSTSIKNKDGKSEGVDIACLCEEGVLTHISDTLENLLY